MPRAIETKPWPGVPRKPLWKKLSGFAWWWWLNDEEPWPPDDLYLGDPQWLRWIKWNLLRNPLFNFFRFVVGVEDRSIIVTGPSPVFITTAWEAYGPPGGFKWSLIRCGILRLPFVSFENARWILYAGWLPSGGRLSVKINVKQSSVQVA